MIQPKPNDKLDAGSGAWSDVTFWSFVLAGAVANLIVATMVFVEFSVIALVNHESKDFRLGLWLVPFVTLVVWGSTTVFYLLAMAIWGIRALSQRLVGRPRSALSARKAVWDDWLDSPKTLDR